ncbi:DNA polymerase IV [Parachitinimonas caeni]|uniref:DNA polymerase IV n=1 Tax=Parachitinimonas caeni TaxID=3031301 RepID=A0ABT7DTK4_9NEIS|nr:DNA polymerase IV [Parachitinimonas caeni]MDK2123410.1 DNA polymerase IV [Parachitinimonas caeni]
MSKPPRKIIHCDCDCFYAAVEMLDDPSLSTQPLAVGGQPGARGVIATCNYVARRFGVRSAMASSHALRICPKLIILPPRFERYRSISRQIMAIYHDYTPLVEPLSLDEAYLDVSDTNFCQGSATLMAQEIRQRIATEVGITASAGIAPNKFVAKIASDWQKPNGQFTVAPHEIDEFVAALPVGKLFGVGKVTAAKLNTLGIETCGQLRDWSLTNLWREFGKFGERLYELCRGIDERPVCPDSVRKSLSVETTYTHDLPDLGSCQAALGELIQDLRQRQQKLNDPTPAHKAFVKLRFADFSQTTAECVDPYPGDATFRRLLTQGFERKQQPVRLLGVGIRFAEPDHSRVIQLSLFDEPPE